MMPSLVFAALALVYAMALARLLAQPRGLPESLVAILLAGLCYDNTVLALGVLGGDAGWYQLLTVLRYAAHAIALPLLLVAGVSVARRAGLRWASYHRMIPAAALVAASGVVFGLTVDVIGIELVTESLYGHSRLVSADSLPPFATITTNIVLLGIGGSLWWQARWPWLFLASLLIFVVNGASASQDWSILAGNLAELQFALAWLATLRRFSFASPASQPGLEPSNA